MPRFPARVGRRGPDDAGVGPDGAPPLPPIARELIGDLVTLDCNEGNEEAQIALDRSGSSRHGNQIGTALRTDGAFGSARTMGGTPSMYIVRDAAFDPGPDGLTIEASSGSTAAASRRRSPTTTWWEETRRSAST